MTDDATTRDDHEDEVARVGIDRLRPDEALYEHFENRPVPVGRDPTDGLPRPLLQQHPFAPPLALDTLVCMPDESSFVRRDTWGYVTEQFSPEEVEQAPNGEWRDKQEKRQVWPIRPQCRHFVRQFMDITDDDKAGMMERCCTARRDSGGEFLSLMNAQIAACELREPRDVASEDLIRRYDRNKMRLGAERRREGAGLDLTKVGVDENEDLRGVID